MSSGTHRTFLYVKRFTDARNASWKGLGSVAAADAGITKTFPGINPKSLHVCKRPAFEGTGPAMLGKFWGTGGMEKSM
jgi:hypothetical protein